MSDEPIAGVDLEAEQVIEEEAEKPVKVKSSKLRPLYLIFGALLVLEAIVMFAIFGQVGGGEPNDQTASAETDEGSVPDVDAATITQFSEWGMIEVGDVSVMDHSTAHPGRSVETTIVGITVWVAKHAWEPVAPLYTENDSVKELIISDLKEHIRKFMAQRGGNNLSHRQDGINEDLLRYFHELHRDSIGGLSRHITRVHHEKVKNVLR